MREMPKHWWGHVVVDVGRQATHGCGDLIFSSHTTFVLTGVLTFTEYGETLVIKVGGWVRGRVAWVEAGTQRVGKGGAGRDEWEQ